MRIGEREIDTGVVENVAEGHGDRTGRHRRGRQVRAPSGLTVEEQVHPLGGRISLELGAPIEAAVLGNLGTGRSATFLVASFGSTT